MMMKKKDVKIEEDKKMNKILLSIMIFILIFTSSARAVDRCQDFIPDVRSQHIRYFGLQYPYWYGLAQLKQESACRANITAFDGGQGIAQFMPATLKDVQARIGEQLNPYNPQQAIRMQAFYMFSVHKGNKLKPKLLWATYQAYNGGWKWLYLENQRAGSSDWADMKYQCQRKTITLKNGELLSFCTVNYDYSKKISKYAQLYITGIDGFGFWEVVKKEELKPKSEIKPPVKNFGCTNK